MQQRPSEARWTGGAESGGVRKTSSFAEALMAECKRAEHWKSGRRCQIERRQRKVDNDAEGEK